MGKKSRKARRNKTRDKVREAAPLIEANAVHSGGKQNTWHVMFNDVLRLLRGVEPGD